jgi:hypothetical protein
MPKIYLLKICASVLGISGSGNRKLGGLPLKVEAH